MPGLKLLNCNDFKTVGWDPFLGCRLAILIWLKWCIGPGEMENVSFGSQAEQFGSPSVVYFETISK